MFRRILIVVAAIGLLAGLSTLAGFALFTDSQGVDNNTFSTGTVDISTSPTTQLVEFASDMAPGDSDTDNPIVVTNAGTLDLRYAITSVTTEDTLAAELDLTIKTIDVTTPGTPCDDFDGTTLYGPADLGSMAGVNVMGDPASGGDAGDRTLAASANETLCFQVELPIGATSPQGTTTTATFAFAAEQTKNNP